MRVIFLSCDSSSFFLSHSTITSDINFPHQKPPTFVQFTTHAFARFLVCTHYTRQLCRYPRPAFSIILLHSSASSTVCTAPPTLARTCIFLHSTSQRSHSTLLTLACALDHHETATDNRHPSGALDEFQLRICRLFEATHLSRRIPPTPESSLGISRPIQETHLLQRIATHRSGAFQLTYNILSYYITSHRRASHHKSAETWSPGHHRSTTTNNSKLMLQPDILAANGTAPYTSPGERPRGYHIRLPPQAPLLCTDGSPSSCTKRHFTRIDRSRS